MQQQPAESPLNQTSSSHQGFLPIETNLFDRIFIGGVCLVAIHLLWLRFVEAYVPLPVATVLSLTLAVFIIWRG